MMATGAYVRIERDGTWQSIEIDHLTDEELDCFFSDPRNATVGISCKAWAIMLAAWIRDNVREGRAINVLCRELEHEGYTHVRVLPDGEIIGVMPMVFTFGLFIGLTRSGWERRYCYEFSFDAVNACAQWNGQGDPPGPWIKEKPSDRLGPGAVDGGEQ